MFVLWGKISFLFSHHLLCHCSQNPPQFNLISLHSYQISCLRSAKMSIISCLSLPPFFPPSLSLFLVRPHPFFSFSPSLWLLMYLLPDFQNVPTSGFAKCTYFWFCKMYLVLILQNVPTSDVHNSGLSKCTYFWICCFINLYIWWCTYFWFGKMYLLLDFENVHTSGFSKCTYFCCT